MKEAKRRFYTAKEVSELLSVSETTAYRMIKKLNDELVKSNYIIIPGRIGKNYFESKIMM